MDYENKYKEANDKVAARFGTNVAKEIFADLYESEDERIRNWLIGYFHQYKEDGMQKYANGLKVESIIAWLEKQGEKKPSVEIKTPEESLNIDSKTYNEIVNDCIFGENEPKFKVGDWILYSGDHYEGVRHITKINENGYYIERNGLPHGIIPFNHEICMRLWTIQDAKDGDVLYAKGSYFKEYLFMFSSFTEDNVISTHFGYDVFHGTFDTKFSRFGRKEDFISVTPATKEQYDLLFQKMHEAGYMWDSKSKQLLSLKAEPSDEQKPTWSEEDEKVALSIEQVINCASLLNIVPEKVDKIRTWLKSLKDRVRPNKEWSEEDKKHIIDIIDYLDDYYSFAKDEDEDVADGVLNEIRWLQSI